MLRLLINLQIFFTLQHRHFVEQSSAKQLKVIFFL